MALTFSGAPEMRKSLLNRTGGLSPAEKLGLSVTFFLLGRKCEPLWDSQVFLPLPFYTLVYLRNLAQGTRVDPTHLSKMGQTGSSVASPSCPPPSTPPLFCGPWSLPLFRTPPGFSGFSSFALGLSVPLAAEIWSREINSFSVEPQGRKQQPGGGRWVWFGLGSICAATELCGHWHFWNHL